VLAPSSAARAVSTLRRCLCLVTLSVTGMGVSSESRSIALSADIRYFYFCLALAQVWADINFLVFLKYRNFGKNIDHPIYVF
jgi:hypothetical protein